MATTGRVLVIDDDAGIRAMLSIVLEQAGHEVRTADGLGRVELGDADVVVLDVRLGRRSALDLLDDQPEIAGVPLVLMTASGSITHAPGHLPAGTRLLTKPFDLDVLEAAVAQAIASGANARTAEAFAN